jgi:hypothetical protein
MRKVDLSEVKENERHFIIKGGETNHFDGEE